MKVGVVMGSESDYEAMQCAVLALEVLGVAHECRVISAHRTPDLMFRYAEEAQGRLAVIIAGAGGSAHLPGMLAAKTLVPVLGVPMASPRVDGLDALLSIAQMPAGVPVATFPVGRAGATNAALFAAALLALTDPGVAERYAVWRDKRRQEAAAVYAKFH